MDLFHLYLTLLYHNLLVLFHKLYFLKKAKESVFPTLLHPLLLDQLQHLRKVNHIYFYLYILQQME
ncbi:MAG: hypothetical protein EBR82_12495 [Caulobacteraceae bacterium]|nr:hypothetical protein [Caulobacteraceae bacterium]